MALRQRISDAYNAFRAGGKRTSAVVQERSNHLRVNPLCSSYENVFGQVRVLIDELKGVRPFGVNSRGNKLPLTQTPELALLDCPNEQMSWSDFADAMFAMWLTEDELNIHVWRNKRGAIAGYSILPVGARHTELGTNQDYFETQDESGAIVRLSRDEVMTLRYSRSPRNLDKGVSPASAGEAYAQLQDVLVQYQKAWFENGAVPASITWIKARTREDFEKKKRDLERELHGAKNKNKTLFLFRSVLDDGTTADEIEVKPIQANNSTMAIKEINNIVTEEINRLFGVSPFLMGDDSSAKYDNAELSDLLFTKRRVMPALRSFWAQFQHELDRIFDGIGYGIDFELEVPELTDRLKVKAETAGKTVENIKALIDAGANPDAVIDALELKDNWVKTAHDLYNEKLRVAASASGQTSDTVRIKPDKNPTETRHVHDGRCGHDCPHHHTTDAPNGDYEPNFTKDEIREAKIYDELVKLLENAISEALGTGVVLSEDDIEKLKAAIQAELIAQADSGADDAAKSIQGFVLGATAEEIKGVLENGGFRMTEDFQKRLAERTETLVERFQGHAKEVVAKVLNPLQEQGLSASEIKRELQKVMPKARAATIARNETIYAFRAGGLENAKYLGDKYELKIKKIWRCHHDDRTCPICEAMDGQTVEVDSAFPDSAEGKDGIRYGWERDSWNDDGQIPSAHVNCRCYFEMEVVNG